MFVPHCLYKTLFLIVVIPYIISTKSFVCTALIKGGKTDIVCILVWAHCNLNFKDFLDEEHGPVYTSDK